MIRSRWYTNPLFVFIFSLVALGTSLFLYIHSYLRVNNAFSDFVRKRNLNPEQFLESETWVMILTLSCLVAIIITGLFIIFLYYRKMIQLYRMQQNFINGFTHELKTPIASLKLFLDTFSKHELPRDQQEKYLQLMIRDTERLSDNVGQILNLAKIEEKKYQAQWTIVNFKTYLEEWLRKNNYLYQELTINIVDKRKEEVWVRIDPELMGMVLMNLFSNAILHNPNKEKTVDVSIEYQGKELWVLLTDNGPGIEKSQMKNIFKKFFQIYPGGKGSGLGLYLVSQVIKYQKGSVEVRSKEEAQGAGCIFILKLPKEKGV
jgi:two-component system, OmpR family, phosphate regulon sensor histidine kinase PhoR